MAMDIKPGGVDVAYGAVLAAAGVHLGLSASSAEDATQAASGELAGGGYARQPAPNWSKSDVANGRQWGTGVAVQFDFTGPVAGTVRSVQVWSALAGGTLLAAVDVDQPFSGIDNGSSIAFAAGSIFFGG